MHLHHSIRTNLFALAIAVKSALANASMDLNQFSTYI